MTTSDVAPQSKNAIVVVEKIQQTESENKASYGGVRFDLSEQDRDDEDRPTYEVPIWVKLKSLSVAIRVQLRARADPNVIFNADTRNFTRARLDECERSHPVL
ncbi:hypothetical protein BV898_12619 [Hypsibius exemplaris]|uniref:Uncharacterized protein n=1 Tax=Hypsibius exemplaris TaxID=2072580 RepID=A0A1W0WD30_HYPEX|nr:hypothetical protein BV898_12619 [Hypsibius exemplaris]